MGCELCEPSCKPWPWCPEFWTSWGGEFHWFHTSLTAWHWALSVVDTTWCQQVPRCLAWLGATLVELTCTSSLQNSQFQRWCCCCLSADASCLHWATVLPGVTKMSSSECFLQERPGHWMANINHCKDTMLIDDESFSTAHILSFSF